VIREGGGLTAAKFLLGMCTGGDKKLFSNNFTPKAVRVSALYKLVSAGNHIHHLPFQFYYKYNQYTIIQKF